MTQQSPWTHHRRAGVADDIDFEIKGEELQFVEIELDPGESAVAEAGAMVWKDATVGMTTVFGDGSGGADEGFAGKLLGAGKRILTGLFGGEGFIMQKLEGDGWIFVQMGGTVVERELGAGEELHVDTGCLAAYTQTIDFDLVAVGGVKSVFFGGEGLFFARLTGPGKVWIQSLPFSRLAGRMLAAAGSRGGKNRGEGSVLGVLGDIVGGNT